MNKVGMSVAEGVQDTALGAETGECSTATSEAVGDPSVSVPGSDGTRGESSEGKSWSVDEDDKLWDVMEQYETIADVEVKWDDVANLVTGRSATECESRWRQCIVDPESWGEEEDDKLKRAVVQHGETQKAWTDAAEMLQNRKWMQCRFRWQQFLHPSLKKGPFTDEEEQLLLEYTKQLDGRWKEIAKRMPGRSRYIVEYHWKSNVRPKLGDLKNVDSIPKPETELKADRLPEKDTVAASTESQTSVSTAAMTIVTDDLSGSTAAPDVSENRNAHSEEAGSDLEAPVTTSCMAVSVPSTIAVSPTKMDHAESSEETAPTTTTAQASDLSMSIDSCDTEEVTGSKVTTVEPANSPGAADGNSISHSPANVDTVTTVAAEPPQTEVTSSGGSTSHLQVTLVSNMSVQDVGPQSTMSVTGNAVTSTSTVAVTENAVTSRSAVAVAGNIVTSGSAVSVASNAVTSRSTVLVAGNTLTSRSTVSVADNTVTSRSAVAVAGNAVTSRSAVSVAGNAVTSRSTVAVAVNTVTPKSTVLAADKTIVSRPNISATVNTATSTSTVSATVASRSNADTGTATTAGLLRPVKSSGGGGIPVRQPRIVQPLSTISTSLVPTAVVYSNRGLLVSSTAKPSSSPSPMTGLKPALIGNSKSYGVTTVLTRTPSGNYVVKPQGVVSMTTKQSQTPIQRPLSSASRSTVSVIQPVRTSQVSVRPAAVVAGSAGQARAQVPVRKIHISCPPTTITLPQQSQLKSKIPGSTPTGYLSLSPQVQVTLTISQLQQTGLRTVSASSGSAFSAFVTAPKALTSSLVGSRSTFSAINAQTMKVAALSSQQQAKPQHTTSPLTSRVLGTLTQMPSTAPVIFNNSMTKSSPAVVLPQQTGSKPVQKRQGSAVTNRQLQGQSRPAPSTTRLESSGATSSVRAALIAAATTHLSRETKITSAVASSGTTQSSKPGGSLPPPPALIHTPKESAQKVARREVISAAARHVLRLSSSSEPTTSTPVSKAESSSRGLLVYSVGSKRLGNLSRINSNAESKDSPPGQRKRPVSDKGPLQNDSGLKRVKIVTGKSMLNEETLTRLPPRRSTLTAEEILLMEKFGQWEDSASSGSDNERGESQQSIRDDPDFRPGALRRFRRHQRASGDGESDGDDHSAKRKKDIQSDRDESRSDGDEDLDVCFTMESVKSSWGGSGYQRKHSRHCKHCGSARFFSRGDSKVYCMSCKRKTKVQVSNDVAHLCHPFSEVPTLILPGHRRT